ncbi:hypothetical protein LIER_25363 [Lithospermum erythrorhizon]|uniref:Uncharacterized protein n=1 Tax=Lithospermum erythrorhizon TaxID=34254 RepID=A0AAV3RAB6_LITER
MRYEVSFLKHLGYNMLVFRVSTIFFGRFATSRRSLHVTIFVPVLILWALGRRGTKLGIKPSSLVANNGKVMKLRLLFNRQVPSPKQSQLIVVKWIKLCLQGSGGDFIAKDDRGSHRSILW